MSSQWVDINRESFANHVARRSVSLAWTRIFMMKEKSSEQFSTYIWSSWTSKVAQLMQVDQDIIDMLSGPDRGSAIICVASQPKSSSQDTKAPDLMSKGSEELPSQSTQTKTDPMDGGSKDALSDSDRRERESPDATIKPEAKSLETASAASSTQEQSAVLGLEAHWRYIKTVKKAQEATKKMHRSMPEWKLKDCMRMCVCVC